MRVIKYAILMGMLSVFSTAYATENVYEHYIGIKDPENKEFNNKEDFIIKENHVNILTSHGSKGLEFKKTLVIKDKTQEYAVW